MQPDQALSFNLHALTARLDRTADRILQTKEQISYSRFLALFMVGELDASTQRALAAQLGITEASVSRMTRRLAADGLLQVVAAPEGGNRRHLSLTPEGRALVDRCARMLEDHLVTLVGHSGIPLAQYARHTRQLITALDAHERAVLDPTAPKGRDPRPDPPASLPPRKDRQSR